MLGKKLKKLVQSSNLSNAQIANHFGYSVNNLYNLYKKDSLDSEIITKSCELFKVPLSYFLGEIAEDVKIEEPNPKIDNNLQIESWREKYFQSQKEVASLRNELKEVRARLDRITDALTDKFLGLELGKAKASSKRATLPTNEEFNLFSLNFGG